MVEEQTGTDMIFEEQEKISETQEIILGDLDGNLPEESNLDPEVQENAPEINEADPGEHDDTGETEKVENVESLVETENKTEETESQVAEKPQNPNA